MNFDVKSLEIATLVAFEKEVGEIINICKNLERNDIKKLMLVSDTIADLNYKRFQEFFSHNTPQKQALFAYNGDVYTAIKTEYFTKEDSQFAQDSVRILSGLYGVLRPMDLIRPYRLEMGAKLKNNLGKNLYFFWNSRITNYIAENLKKQDNKILVNLASKEYSRVINRHNFPDKMVDIIFQEKRNESIRVIPINSKKARGVMLNFIIKEKVNTIEHLKGFEESGYKFDKTLSSDSEFFFTRLL